MTGSLCTVCDAPIDWSRPISVRVFVKDRHGRERELCRSCWSNDLPQKAVRK